MSSIAPLDLPAAVAQLVEVRGHDAQVRLRREDRPAHPRRCDGAITASMNVDVSAVAVSASSGRFRPTMPPKADSGSASRART